MQTLFCYLAFQGMPYWNGLFYIIDMEKHKFFMNLIENENFSSAERMMMGAPSIGAWRFDFRVPPKECSCFTHHDMGEYYMCVRDAYMQVLMQAYIEKGMHEEAANLFHLMWWKDNCRLLDAQYNDLALEWNKNFHYKGDKSGKEACSPALNECLSKIIKPSIILDYEDSGRSSGRSTVYHWDLTLKRIIAWNEQGPTAYPLVYKEIVNRSFDNYEYTFATAGLIQKLVMARAYQIHLIEMKSFNITQRECPTENVEQIEVGAIYMDKYRGGEAIPANIAV